MPGFLRHDVQPFAHVMEIDEPWRCTRCGDITTYMIMQLDPTLQPGDPCSHEILALYPFANELVGVWNEGEENAEKGIPYNLWRWIPLVDATLAPGIVVRFFQQGFARGHMDQPSRYTVVDMKTDQNLVFSDLHVVDR